MIITFSGAGMSARASEWIDFDAPRTLGLVFPVYGWRIPKVLRRRIRAELKRGEYDFIWAVVTCGDDVGLIDKELDSALMRAIGQKLDAIYSLVMPDTYLALPGFKLDTPKESEAKLLAAQKRAKEIRQRLTRREKVRDLKRGMFPWLKTRIVGAIFDRFFANDRGFHLTSGKCIKCMKCVKNCPTAALTIDKNGYPTWKKDGSCTACFRCYHLCRGDAIEWGRFTLGKGRLNVQQ